jgi:hypothetical protein
MSYDFITNPKLHLSVMLHTVCICEHPSTRDHKPTARENKTEQKKIKQVGMLCVLSLLLALQILNASQIYQQIQFLLVSTNK